MPRETPRDILKPADARLLVGTIYITRVVLLVLHGLGLMVVLIAVTNGNGVDPIVIIPALLAVAVSGTLRWVVLGGFENSLSALVQIAINSIRR